IDGLRATVTNCLRQLAFPFDEDAIARLIEVVEYFATTSIGKRNLRFFIQSLWETSRFRDACEQRFSVIDFGADQSRRARSLRIAAVSLISLPAYTGRSMCCLEEPFPFSDYRKGITAFDKEALLVRYRESWKAEHLSWLNARIQAVLKT